MDKQIIIDGVNVKDCKRRIGKDNFCRYYKRPCAENNYNCIWKKYLRKEQECERLKKIIDEAKNSKLDLKSFLVGEAVQNEYEQQLDQLEADNEELKKCYKNNLALLDFEETNTAKLVNKVMKLEKTLAEIKEIAEKSDMPPCLNIDCNCEKCKDGTTEKGSRCMQYGLVKILQKISEVEDEN